jgi:SH3 domain protein
MKALDWISSAKRNKPLQQMITAHFRVIPQAVAPIGFLLLSLTVNAAAETRYVTDILQLSLYQEINSGGDLLRRLNSGTELELLETSGFYARVRTKDGVEGWTKAGFLITEKPARAQLEDLKAENAGLQAQVTASQQALEAAQGQISKTTDKQGEALAEMAQRLESAEKIAARVSLLEQENETLRQSQQQGPEPVLGDLDKMTIPVKWGLIGCGIALLLGSAGGIALFDYRSRKRHGGYRIY